MSGLIFSILFAVNVFASSVISDHLLGDWGGGMDHWHFQVTAPQATQIVKRKFLDYHNKPFYCRVEWSGRLTLKMCSEASRDHGYCNTRGRVAKYILAVNFDDLKLLPDAENGDGCAAAVAQLSTDKTKFIYLAALALNGQNELWLSGNHLLREVL